jgi:hypothetical protein
MEFEFCRIKLKNYERNSINEKRVHKLPSHGSVDGSERDDSKTGFYNFVYTG